MSGSLLDFTELLNPDDDDGFVDVVKLREYAAHGIPAEIRGDVWLYLLGVVSSDKSTHAAHRAILKEHYDSLDTAVDSLITREAIDSEMARYHPHEPCFKRPEVRQKMRHVIGAYLNHRRVPFTPRLLRLLAPLAAVADQEYLLYASMDALLSRIDLLSPIERRCSEFLSLFRLLLGDVFHHLEDQEINPTSWVLSWLQGMLSRELPLEAVHQLWDFYLADEAGFAVHPFVCIAIIDKCKEDLEELEHLDLKTYFQSLPKLDVNEIIVISDNARRTTDHLL